MDDPSPLTKTLYLTGLDCPRKWYKEERSYEVSLRYRGRDKGEVEIYRALRNLDGQL